VAVPDIDIYNVKRMLERVNEVRDLAGATLDGGFLRHARRSLLPLPVLDRPQRTSAKVFPPLRRRPARALQGKRVALVASGGAGACVAMAGAARAFEEAGIEVELISGCSGGAIWGAMWAAGMDAQEMARFSLRWQPEDYLDVRWTGLPRFALSALRGFTGAMKGEALEQLFDARLIGIPAGELAIPLQTIVYNMDLGTVEYFGSRTTPQLPIGRLVRIAVALPLFIESVEVGGHLYVDGGIIDVVPIQPILDDGTFDHVIALNHMLPPQFEAEDITGWQETRMGVLRASRQLQQGYHLEFARRNRALLGDQLTVIDPVDHTLCRGVDFYDLFIDRRRWPELIRSGYERTSAALDQFRRARTRPAAA
jgi:NTE family protein